MHAYLPVALSLCTSFLIPALIALLLNIYIPNGTSSRLRHGLFTPDNYFSPLFFDYRISSDAFFILRLFAAAGARAHTQRGGAAAVAIRYSAAPREQREKARRRQ